MSQSGGPGIESIKAAGRLGLGLSSSVSVGNKADLSGNDFLQYWEQDPGTELALLYLKSFGDPRKFARIARRVAANKPILAVKSGRSAAGARATSHRRDAVRLRRDRGCAVPTGRRDPDRHHPRAVPRRGAHLVATVPRGDRVAIVTNGGGPGILCRGRLPGRRTRDHDALGRHPSPVVELPADVGRGPQSGRHDRVRLGRRLSADASDPNRGRRVRRDRRDLRTSARDRGCRCGDRDPARLPRRLPM